MEKIGWYAPRQVVLSAVKPSTLKKLPDGLSAPLYGVLPIGPAEGTRACHVVLDEPAGAAAVLYVDSNGDGDMTNDPRPEWKPSTDAEKLTTWFGGAFIRLGDAAAPSVWIGVYRFDRNDPKRAAYRSMLFYYRDYDYEGTVTLDGKVFKAVLNDENVGGDFRGQTVDESNPRSSSGVQLLLDLNGNGRFESPAEALDVRRPFNIGGTTWEIAGLTAAGGAFSIQRSARHVAETLPPPDLGVGRAFPSFDAVDMGGAAVRFPSDFRGKVVMLDFWATWCGPCMEDVPGVVETYRGLSAKGFEILGVTLDDAGQAAHVKDVMKSQGMTWRQIYDGGGWQAALATRFLVDAIPAAFLVDGDTGLILASGDTLRGEDLRTAVEQALRRKGKI